jgi:DNA-binding transcriptional regulator YiaG
MTPEQLREALERLEISQVTASRWLAVDPRTVRRWVLGERRIPGMVAEMVKTWLTTHRAKEAAE